MSGLTSEIYWFPKISDRFVTWGSEINLYQAKYHADPSLEPRCYTNNNFDISNTSTATLLATETRYQHIRCLAPSFQQSELIAVGLSNGKVGLSNFMVSSENANEFTPKQSRPCICLGWHEIDKNLLAIGYDRYRNDHCITIWDTERGIAREKSIVNLIGLSETAHSLCWDRQNRILLAGISHRNLKLMDLRQPTIITATANTRAVLGVCAAPNERIFASYIDNNITLWDIRSIEKPLSIHQTEKNICSLNWCTTRSNTLATIQRDSPYIHLMDLHWPAGEMDIEPHTIKRQIAPYQQIKSSNNSGGVASGTAATRSVSLSNISWHPTDVERLLILLGNRNICDFKIQQRVAISWDPYNNLCGSTGVNLNYINTISPPTTPSDITSPWETIPQAQTMAVEYQIHDDIADLIHRRALLDYGKLIDIQQNGNLAQNPMLKSVWKLLATMNKKDCLLGIGTVLGITNNTIDGLSMACSESLACPWPDYPHAMPAKIFKSEQRKLAQQLCGWDFDKLPAADENFNSFIADLCAKHEFIRAALIAGFQLQIRLAIEILGRGAEYSHDSNNLRMAAIGLSGLNFEKSTMWRTQCTNARAQIKDPHLRAFFAFLTPDNDSYDDVLKESSLSVSDRIAFACQFLCDTKLADYVKDMIKKCIEIGDLNGLLLTGATADGITLMQSYLNWTDDVQSVALISTKFLSKDLITDNSVQYWISSYRELLDVWGLWEQRAHFDVTMGQTRSPPRYSRSVFLLCSFCGKSVSTTLQEQTALRNTTSSSSVNKLSSCPNCHKPLPRCSLCLLHMGTTTGVSMLQNHHHPNHSNTNDHSNNGWQLKPFSKWFSWCQTCRHGGHTEHLSNWFSQHLECPVASCSCKCFALDLSIPKFPKGTSY